MNTLHEKPEHRAKAEELRTELERWRDLLGDDRSFDGKPLGPCGNRMTDL
jgi:hypothetical protein